MTYAIHDDSWCEGKRRYDQLDEEVSCRCGYKHYRCVLCRGIVDGLHPDGNRWDGARYEDSDREEERWR